MMGRGSRSPRGSYVRGSNDVKCCRVAAVFDSTISNDRFESTIRLNIYNGACT